MLPRYYNTLQDLAGNALKGATITVKRHGRFGLSDATLYSDRYGTSALGTNIVSSSAERGEVAFYAPSGWYRLDVAMTGFEPFSIDDELLPLSTLTAEYFGILPGATGDISTALQNWINELLGDDPEDVDSSVASDVIELPWLNAKAQVRSHPALSFIGRNRAGTILNLPDNAQPLGLDAVRAMFYLIARKRGTTASSAWVPQFENMLLQGNKDNQSNNACPGIYLEPATRDPSYSGDTTPYSSMQGRNLEVYSFSGPGISSKAGRQRLTLTHRCRSSQHGILSGTTVVTLANALEIYGNDPVISDCGFGSSTGHAVLMSGGSGLVFHGNNVFASRARSDNALTLMCHNINGATIGQNVFNDTVCFESTVGDDAQYRGITFAGNDFRPNTGVFTSDGVPAGTASASANAFIKVDTCKNVAIGLNCYNASLDGSRYEYLASFIGGSAGHIDYAALSATAYKPWHTTQPVPLFSGGGSTPHYTFHDLTNMVSRMNGCLAVGVAENTAVDTGYSLVVGQLPSLFTQAAEFKRGIALIWGESVESISPVTNGGTENSPDKRTEAYLSNNSLIVGFTYGLPVSPHDGQQHAVVTKGGISTLSLVLQAAAITAGHTILAPTSYALAAGGGFKVRWKADTKQWFPSV